MLMVFMPMCIIDRTHQVKASDRFAVKTSKQFKMTYYYYHSTHGFLKQDQTLLAQTRCSYEYLDRRETKRIQKVIIK